MGKNTLRRCRLLGILQSLLFFSLISYAEEPADPALLDLNLEQLMKVTVVSREPMTQADAPGIVTVITREQIKNSGAQNLVDIFRLVPGFQVASDYNGTLSLGVRGLWAIEGKVLYMIDGLEMNDGFYNTSLFGYTFPVQQISRIEIIRGPGSVIYGGSAEYAVVNVITLSGQELNGAQVSAHAGRMKDGQKRQGVELAYGKKYGEDAEASEVSLKMSLGEAGISDRDRTYPDASTFSAKDYEQNIHNVNASIQHRGITFRALVDQNRVQSRDAFGVPLVDPTEVRFSTYLGQIEYEWKKSDKLSMTPTYTYKRSSPYNNGDSTLATVGGGSAIGEYHFDYQISRDRFFLPVSYRINEDLRLLAGAEYYRDYVTTDNLSLYPDRHDPSWKSRSIKFYTRAIFSELIWQTAFGNFSGGARYESHSVFADSAVPRLSWTKRVDPWNFKLLYSHAYRAPSVGNINNTNSIGGDLDPERTRVVEGEVGYRLSSSTSISLNLFDILCRETIVYDAITFGYANAEQTGSYGAELQVRQVKDWGFSNVALSYYDAHSNEIPRYAVAQSEHLTAGFANFKATWSGQYRFSEKLNIQPTLIHLSERYGFDGLGGTLTTRKTDPTTVVNVFFGYDNLFVKGLELTAGVANITDEDDVFLTAYDLGRNTLPGPSREFLVNLTFR